MKMETKFLIDDPQLCVRIDENITTQEKGSDCNVSADKNKNNNPVLLRNKHLPTVILRTHASKPVSNRQTKIICKQTLLIFLFVLYKLRNTCK